MVTQVPRRESRMRWAVGVDLEEVGGFERALKANRRLFFSRTFTKAEIRYCNSKAGPARHFAGTFAAKEATVKAVSQLIHKTVTVSEFGIARSRLGAPSVKWLRSPKPRGLQVRISVSHTAHYSVAVALAMLRE